MRTASMCFSILQVPRQRFFTLANICLQTFSGNRTCKTIHTSTRIDYRAYGVGGHNRRWTRRPITTEIESKENIRLGIAEEAISSTKLNINRLEDKGVQEIQYSDIQVKIAENKDLASLVTVIIMDIETSGFLSDGGKIIEVGFQDLKGGHNSTFQTLVNPHHHVSNSHIHNITTDMVNRPGVPRMEELIPIIIQYINSRRQPGGHVVLVAHNGRVFDFPFMKSEFNRCSYEIPSDWLFLDTLPLAREAKRAKGETGQIKASLEVLREHYGVPLVGSAHRAMSDVHSLALIFQKITFDLKLPVSELMQKCFTASDLGSTSKKKKTTTAKKKNQS